MADFSVVAERTALVNIDMQNCFVEGSPFSARGGRTALEKINLLAAACRAAGILVIHASHVLRPDGSNTGILGELAPIVKQGSVVTRPLERQPSGIFVCFPAMAQQHSISARFQRPSYNEQHAPLWRRPRRVRLSEMQAAIDSSNATGYVEPVRAVFLTRYRLRLPTTSKSTSN